MGIMASLTLWRSWTRCQEWGPFLTASTGVLWEQIGCKRPGLSSWEIIGLSPCWDSVARVYWFWVITWEGFLRKTCTGEWCQATDGASVSQTWGSIGGKSGGRFWVWGLAKGLGAIWMQRINMGSKNGRFIEVCSLTRRSHPINATGHWGTTIKECVSVAFGKIPWRRKWQPTTVLLHGKSHTRLLHPWGNKESDTTSLSLSPKEQRRGGVILG